MHNNAFIVGKFLPPHLGHLALIKAGHSVAKNVFVAVEQQPNEPLSASLRALLMQQDVPQGVIVKPFLKTMPADPSLVDDEEKFWELWKKEIHELCPSIDVLLSSDDYGARLAYDQLAQWVKVDRTAFPISATWLKGDFWERMDNLMPTTRAFFTKRIALVGGESTGKSTLAKTLAHQLNTKHVPELAQQIIVANKLNPNKLTPKDLLSFSLSQKATRAGVLSLASRILFEDSNELTTAMFARLLGFEDLALDLTQQFLDNPPHHTIVCLKEGAVFHKDIHRLEHPSDGVDFIEQHTLNFLKKHNLSFSCVAGDWLSRTNQALDTVHQLKKQWETLDFPSHCEQAKASNLFVVSALPQDKKTSPVKAFKV